MPLLDAIAQRHSVRSYLPDPIGPEDRERLSALVADANRTPGLSFRLAFDEPRAFSSSLPAYGAFKGVTNYLVCAGERSLHLSQDVGYAGELIVLEAQEMGLNSCWVGLTYKHGIVRGGLAPDEKLVCVVALGHGAGSGSTHPVKPLEKLCTVEGGVEAPAWFQEGMWAAQLAPTAMNQQRFHITYRGGTVRAEALPAPYADVDLGIVKRHFELGAGAENVCWA
ncbi:nitroreductase family protein [Olsenella sp. YH-ols2217]|uniref:Nitroreductase family protein n=1 Tax=Kribbibacterium absianum TaxID=3044210 RepID=A0ABT6ZJA9_9ACTN|nr:MULTISPECIES: nitroreductase family protein [unclassified Olsenella]MDJ1122698.1 nitroreductase family protein [Olsenella sp. YH-ols2216]MDJ1129136.1 nitroreductase family protein [Olsenella sp. YH-ols2217]